MLIYDRKIYGHVRDERNVSHSFICKSIIVDESVAKFSDAEGIAQGSNPQMSYRTLFELTVVVE